MTKRTIPAVLLSLLLPTQAFPAVSGSVSAGGQVVNAVPDSSKFNEYRDLKDGPYLYDFDVTSDMPGGYLFELSGSNAGRADQRYRLWAGRQGSHSLEFEWDEIPHALSNKAKTPYTHQGGGLLTVPGTVPLATKSLTPTAPQLVANDSLTAAYLRGTLKPLDLGNDREKASAIFKLFPVEGLTLRLGASNEERGGNKVSYGPIGDRPPRSLNIQLEEPIDYATREMKFEADYQGKRSQTNLTFELSSFQNRIDAVTWQNIYVDPAVGTNEVWLDGRRVASYGRRPLPQDNLYRSVSVTHGVDLPLSGRLTAAASYGVAEQDSNLTPYSTSGAADAAGDGLAWNDAAKLPRGSAQAKHESKLLSLDYAANPFERTHVRAFGRYYGLSNKTPTSDWKYVTQDVTSGTGGVNHHNKRRNVAYQYAKQNYGLEGDYSIAFWRTTLGLGYEHERVERDNREANTAENIARLSARSWPLKWLSARAKYQYGNRQATNYDPNRMRASYWYAPAEAAGAANADAANTFDNHPDMRRWDVSDRQRHDVDFTLAAAPIEALDVSLSHRYRRDDHDSGVGSSQPLLDYAGARAVERTAASPGDQVGLLKDTRQSVGVDASYAVAKRVRLTFFGSREHSDSRHRGFEYQENNKADPSTVNGAELGPWTRANNQWMADIRDTTYSFGVGAEVDLIPEKLTLDANYNHSIGKVAIDYSGWGAVNPLTGAAYADNNQFGFRTPPVIRNDRYVVSTSMGYKVRKDLTVSLGYMFDYFKQRDWQQESDTPQSESVDGTEEMTRDTSQSNQWGNRLPNMGPYLASSYEAHLISLRLSYKF